MIDQSEINEEINYAVSYWLEQMPEEVRKMISTARWDILHGPNQNPDWPGWEIARMVIGEFFDQISDIWVETGDYDEDIDGYETEPVDGSAEQIKRRLCGTDEAGRQLFAML